jgi:hypothetical protein
MKRLFVVAAFCSVACAAGFANSGSFSTLTPSLRGINAAAPRYTTDDERLVSEIAGSILNIAAFADHFETGDSFQVRNTGRASGLRRFSLARRAEVFTVEVAGHVWVPAAYVRLARSFMADGAGLTISEDAIEDRVDAAAILDAGSDALGLQNARLSRLLADHPRSPALHERAGLLLAAAAKRNALADRREMLCRMTAHLAVARALRQGSPSADGQVAERLLSELAARQPAGVVLASNAWVDGPVTFGDHPQLQILPAVSAADLRR